jgi:hypothetical protein
MGRDLKSEIKLVSDLGVELGTGRVYRSSNHMQYVAVNSEQAGTDEMYLSSNPAA